MIRDSRRSFEFSRLNYLFSWAFSRQDKKIKIGIINGSVKFERHLNTLITVLIVSLCLVLIISILLTIKPANLKKLSSGISEKHDQTSITLTNILILRDNFQIMLCLMKSNVPLLNVRHTNLQKSHNLPQWVDINSI